MDVLQLDNLAHGGEAVGRLAGKAIFVAGGIPGERVRVEIVEDAPRYSRACLVEVLEPSPDRVTPPCPYYAECGGCHLQHIRYERQLAAKAEIVRQQLTRLAGLAEPPVLPMLGMAEPWAYRNHVQLHVQGGAVGYQASRSHNIVRVEHCPIAHPLLASLWPREMPCGVERLALRAGVATGERLVLLEAAALPEPASTGWPAEVNVVADLGGRAVALQGVPWYHERLFERELRVSARSFFQNNTAQAQVLIDCVREALALDSGEVLLDAYCGVGAFLLLLLPPGGRGLGIESFPEAVADARVNARALHSGQVTFLEGDVARVLARRALTCDAVVLDPPRAGCSTQALARIIETGARRIAYVSCDPATLARDIGHLQRSGYRLERVQPVDMFPQTYHIECVALLCRAS